MLAQTETKSKTPFGNRNGRADKSDGLDPQFVKLKKDLSLALREISSQNRCVRATDELSRSVIETASHRPASSKLGYSNGSC